MHGTSAYHISLLCSSFWNDTIQNEVHSQGIILGWCHLAYNLKRGIRGKGKSISRETFQQSHMQLGWQTYCILGFMLGISPSNIHIFHQFEVSCWLIFLCVSLNIESNCFCGSHFGEWNVPGRKAFESCKCHYQKCLLQTCIVFWDIHAPYDKFSCGHVTVGKSAIEYMLEPHKEIDFFSLMPLCHSTESNKWKCSIKLCCGSIQSSFPINHHPTLSVELSQAFVCNVEWGGHNEAVHFQHHNPMVIFGEPCTRSNLFLNFLALLGFKANPSDLDLLHLNELFIKDEVNKGIFCHV